MSTAIEFNHVGKQYRLGLVSTKTLSHDLDRWWQTAVLKKEDPYLKIGEVNDRSKAGDSEYVWALRDIDFKVEQGDVVGIIGKNGAGKSTLLKLLSKVTGPTVGTIRARGRIGALLEVGTGFHPEMTGRENIYMNGAILGMSKAEVASKIDEIIDFSGCERYIDTPVKRYSSGMTVRLGFAVAAHLDPEILVVDEVLAVGDAEFQKKAIGKMREVSMGGGRTVLFVSHNMASIRKLCKNGILLDNGQIAFQGNVADTIATYLTSADYEDFEGPATQIHILNNSIKIAGDDFTADIQEYMSRQHNVKVSERMAERIKINVGAALTDLESDIPDNFIVHGPNRITALPMEVPVCYQEIAHCLEKSLTRIETAVLSALENTPPELYADIVKNGIFMTGGGALLRGLDKRLQNKINIPFHVADDPLRSVAKGTGIALENVDHFEFLMR